MPGPIKSAHGRNSETPASASLLSNFSASEGAATTDIIEADAIGEAVEGRAISNAMGELCGEPPLLFQFSVAVAAGGSGRELESEAGVVGLAEVVLPNNVLTVSKPTCPVGMGRLTRVTVGTNLKVAVVADVVVTTAVTTLGEASCWTVAFAGCSATSVVLDGELSVVDGLAVSEVGADIATTV